MTRIAAVGVALLLALAGCATDLQPPATGEPVSATPSASTTPSGRTSVSATPSPIPTSGRAQVLEGDGFRTLVAGAEGARQAEISGRLAVGDGGCLIVNADHGQGYVVAWPPGVTLLTDGRIGVNVPGVGEITAGERFSGAGGYSKAPLSRGLPPGRYPAIPRECATDGAEVAVVDNLDSFRIG